MGWSNCLPCVHCRRCGPDLVNTTCPCGRGYFDDQGCFVPGNLVRSGQRPSREEYNAQLSNRPHETTVSQLGDRRISSPSSSSQYPTWPNEPPTSQAEQTRAQTYGEQGYGWLQTPQSSYQTPPSSWQTSRYGRPPYGRQEAGAREARSGGAEDSPRATTQPQESSERALYSDYFLPSEGIDQNVLEGYIRKIGGAEAHITCTIFKVILNYYLVL
jgi:hypothetical protein